MIKQLGENSLLAEEKKASHRTKLSPPCLVSSHKLEVRKLPREVI